MKVENDDAFNIICKFIDEYEKCKRVRREERMQENEKEKKNKKKKKGDKQTKVLERFKKNDVKKLFERILSNSNFQEEFEGIHFRSYKDGYVGNGQDYVAFDPGLDHVLTLYGCKNNELYTIQCTYKDDEKLQKYKLILDNIKSVLKRNIFKDECKKAMIKKLMNLYQYLNAKLKNKIRNLHHILSKFLSLFNIVITPETTSADFRASQGETSNAVMIGIKNHFKLLKFSVLKEYLKYKSNCIKVEEQLTSKICSNCKSIHSNLKPGEKFKCPYCSKEFDRDENAAKNIYFRACHRFGFVILSFYYYY